MKEIVNSFFCQNFHNFHAWITPISIYFISQYSVVSISISPTVRPEFFSLALLSLKSHQMTIVFNKNENWEKNEVVLMKTSSFWTKTVVIWWLLRMTSGVKSIKTVGYNGVGMVFVLDFWHFRVWNISWVWNSENIIYLKLGSDKLSSN